MAIETGLLYCSRQRSQPPKEVALIGVPKILDIQICMKSTLLGSAMNSEKL